MAITIEPVKFNSESIAHAPEEDNKDSMLDLKGLSPGFVEIEVKAKGEEKCVEQPHRLLKKEFTISLQPMFDKKKVFMDELMSSATSAERKRELLMTYEFSYNVY